LGELIEEFDGIEKRLNSCLIRGIEVKIIDLK